MQQAMRNSDRLATTGRLAATLAHEIHNPLDAVGGLLFLIQQSTKEAETQRFVSMASEELALVTQMTQQMLTFQRESTKPLPVQSKRFSIMSSRSTRERSSPRRSRSSRRSTFCRPCLPNLENCGRFLPICWVTPSKLSVPTTEKFGLRAYFSRMAKGTLGHTGSIRRQRVRHSG